jgi:hypothetical protein
VKDYVAKGVNSTNFGKSVSAAGSFIFDNVGKFGSQLAS